MMRLAKFGQLEPKDENPALQPAVRYALAFAPDAADLAARLVNHSNQTVASAAVETLSHYPDISQKLITPQWIEDAAKSPEAGRRRLAAIGVELQADGESRFSRICFGTTIPGSLRRPLAPPGNCRAEHISTGCLRCSPARSSGRTPLRRWPPSATESSARLATSCSTRRRRSPFGGRSRACCRTFRLSARSTFLLACLNEPDLTVRASILKALNIIRENHPKLNYGRESVSQQIMSEARYYYEMSAALHLSATRTRRPRHGCFMRHSRRD